jgi:hypothetical protein
MKLLALWVALMTFPLSGYSQTYADSPFSVDDTIPSSARVEGWQHGSIHANGIAVDLSESHPALAIEQIADWNLQQEVDGAKPAQVFRFYIQYNRLGVTFGYNLLAQPVEGTDKIRCTFSQLTDSSSPAWNRDKSIAPVALPADLPPLMIRSGQAIAISTYPVGEDKAAVVHYLRLTRMDATLEKSQGPSH